MEAERIKAQRVNNAVRACLAASVILLVPVVLFSQTQSSSTQNGKDEPVIACNLGVNLGIVEAEVKDQYRAYVPDLDRNEFIVYDNSQKQEIQYFSQEKKSDTEAERITYKIGYFQPDGLVEGDLRRIRVMLRDAKKRGLRVSYSPKSYFVTSAK